MWASFDLDFWCFGFGKILPVHPASFHGASRNEFVPNSNTHHRASLGCISRSFQSFIFTRPPQKRDWSKNDVSTTHKDTMDDCPSVFRFWKWVRPQITQPPDASLEQYQCICETLQEFQNCPGWNYRIWSKFWNLVIILKCCKDCEIFGLAWLGLVRSGWLSIQNYRSVKVALLCY